jgi:hypothetical protein
MFKKSKPLIEFVSTLEGLESIKECLPRPTKGYIPDWFKNVPNLENTVKACPSFPDFFSQGFVLPMWMDSTIKYDSVTDRWSSESYFPNWDAHTNNQFMDFTKPYMQGKESNFVFKANCPWKLITPPGYSVLQLPLFYHFNQEFSVLPGIIDTDIYSEINQQILYHGEGNSVHISRGTPLAMYVPFKRTKYDLEIRYQTEKDRKLFVKKGLDFVTKAKGSGVYRGWQRDRSSHYNKPL